MRWRRLVRTMLVYALLGAVATVLSAWAIQGWHHWRMARTNTLTRNWVGAAYTESSPDDPPIDLASPPWRDHRRVPAGLGPATGFVARNGGLWERERFAWRFRWRSIDVLGTIDGAGGDERLYLHTRESLGRVEVGWPRRAMTLGAYSGWFAVDDAPALFEAPAREFAASTPALSLRGGFAPLGWPLRARAMPSQTIATPNPFARFALPLLPLWPGFLINTLFYALLLFFAWRVPIFVRRALRRRGGRCVRCGYDRDGLDAGAACPECGAEVAMGNWQWGRGGGRPATRRLVPCVAAGPSAPCSCSSCWG